MSDNEQDALSLEHFFTKYFPNFAPPPRHFVYNWLQQRHGPGTLLGAFERAAQSGERFLTSENVGEAISRYLSMATRFEKVPSEQPSAMSDETEKVATVERFPCSGGTPLEKIVFELQDFASEHYMYITGKHFESIYPRCIEQMRAAGFEPVICDVVENNRRFEESLKDTPQGRLAEQFRKALS